MNVLLVMCVLLFLQIPNSNMQSNPYDKITSNKEDHSQEKNYFKVYNDSSTKEKAAQIHVTTRVKFTPRTTNLKELTSRSDISSEETNEGKKMSAVECSTSLMTTANTSLLTRDIAQNNTPANKLEINRVDNLTLKDVTISLLTSTVFVNDSYTSGDLPQRNTSANKTEINKVQKNTSREKLPILLTTNSRENSVNLFTSVHTIENTSANERDPLRIVTKVKMPHNDEVTKVKKEDVANVDCMKDEVIGNNTSKYQDTKTKEVKQNDDFPSISTKAMLRRIYLPDLSLHRNQEFSKYPRYHKALRAGATLAKPVKRMFNTKIGLFTKREYDRYSFDSRESNHHGANRGVRGQRPFKTRGKKKPHSRESYHHGATRGPRGDRPFNTREKNKEHSREYMSKTIRYQYGVNKDIGVYDQTSDVRDKDKSGPREYTRSTGRYNEEANRDETEDQSRTARYETTEGPKEHWEDNLDGKVSTPMGKHPHHEANKDVSEDESRDIPDKDKEDFRQTAPMSTPKSPLMWKPEDLRTITTLTTSTDSVNYGEVETDVTEDQWANIDRNNNKNNDHTVNKKPSDGDGDGVGEETGAVENSPSEDAFNGMSIEENNALRSTKLQKSPRPMVPTETTKQTDDKTKTPLSETTKRTNNKTVPSENIKRTYNKIKTVPSETSNRKDKKIETGPSGCRVLCDGEEFTNTGLAWKHRCRVQPNGHDCDDGGTIRKYYFSLNLMTCVAGDFGKSCPFNYLNKFETLNECYWQCIDVANVEKQQLIPPKVFCKFQPQYGSCDEYHPRWYYDLTLRKCAGFSYSGCGGNVNRFNTNEDCNKTCSGFERRYESQKTTKVTKITIRT